MSTLALEVIRDCLDGQIPAGIATCAADGVPNATYVSQVHYVDAQHVALSFQFFNKTRENILDNPRAAAFVIDPLTGARYRLHLQYLRTETDGPVFQNMKAKLAGIASHTGMSGVFHLKGADIYRVLDLAPVEGQTIVPAQPRRSLLGAVRAFAQSMSRFCELGELLDGALAQIELQLGVAHSMIHWLDETGERLYLIASRGYPQSGVGSEIQRGHGVIGVAADERTPIRITHATAEYTYSRAARESVRQSHLADRLEAEIPAPGLPAPGSQLAVPILFREQLLGVLYVEDARDSQFGYDEEDALVAIAQHLGLAAQLLGQSAQGAGQRARRQPPAAEPAGKALVIRHYAAAETVFVDDNYLIKGVAGAILWKLLREFVHNGRSEFSNRELRLDTALPLPDLSTNLEARLILLKRRLAERCPDLAIESRGRGRFRLRVNRPLRLVEAE